MLGAFFFASALAGCSSALDDALDRARRNADVNDVADRDTGVPPRDATGDPDGELDADLDAGRETSDLEREPPDIPRPPTTLADVVPIFQSRCAECHIDGPQLPFLRDDDGLMARLSGASVQFPTMPWITPGRPESSYLLHKAEGTHVDLGGPGFQMPLGRPLPDTERATLRLWIEEGALAAPSER